ncbi:WD40 repeat-like protein [Gyrodon lividus]|nr:WD40 repeat-like protein [Gyrodon lividus]
MISGHEGTIWNLAYLPGGERVVTCSPDATVRIWNVKNGEQEGTSMEHDGWLNGLAVTRDGKRILSGGKDNRIRLWDMETHEFIEEWEGHTGGILCIVVSQDGQLVVSGDHDGKIVIREMKEGGEIKHAIQAGSEVWSVSFSPDGEKFAAAVYDVEGGHVIRVYDVKSGKPILGPIKGHETWIRCILWSLDGCRLFSASDDHSIRCWNSEKGEPIGQPWTGHTNWVFSLSLSPDGTKLASASWDNTVRFWDAHSGEHIEQPLQHDDWLRAVTFSPSGQFMACGGDDKKVSIWRVPWWDDGQKQAHDSLLDLPAVLVPKGISHNQAQLDLDLLDLPRHPITLSCQPLVPPDNSTPPPIIKRIQRFWRGLVAPRSPSSPSQPAIELQPIETHRFWKSVVRTPVTEVAASRMTDRYAVGRREPRRKKKEAKPQTHAELNSSATGADPSSHADPSGSTSNAGPSNSQTGPSTSSNAATQGRISNFVQSDVASDDSWDDMDSCGQCLDYFCGGPRPNRERFRPWKKKSRAVLEAEEQARKEKKRAKPRKHQHRKNNAPRTQKAAHPSNQHASQCDHITAVSPAPPIADEVTPERPGEGQQVGMDHGVTFQLQEEIEQLRRQRDEAIAARHEAEAEGNASEKMVEELQYESHISQERQTYTGLSIAEAGPFSSHVEPLVSTSNVGPPTSHADSSTPSNGAVEGRRSSLTQSNSDSIDAEERAKKEKMRAKAEK